MPCGDLYLFYLALYRNTTSLAKLPFVMHAVRIKLGPNLAASLAIYRDSHIDPEEGSSLTLYA